MGSWRAPGEPMTPEASHCLQRASQGVEFEQKVKQSLKQSTSLLLETSCKTNEAAGAYFIHPLRCDEIIFWNLRVLRPVQFIFYPLFNEFSL